MADAVGTEFQFHTGSIKSRRFRAHPHQNLPHFNSTLVRLKGYLGRLSGEKNPNFNSTLVRLKAVIVVTAGAASPFQFHTGSIKS